MTPQERKLFFGIAAFFVMLGTIVYYLFARVVLT